MRTKLLITFLVLFASTIFAQHKVEAFGYVVEGRIEDNDTVFYVNIKEVVVFAPKRFKNKRHERKYYRLVRNLKKVYPYAKLANLKLKEIRN